MLIKKDFTFDAAHFLTKYHGKCENLHGHTYSLSVTLEGEPGIDGMIIDFQELSDLVRKDILTKLDHQDLNQLFPNPTTEVIAKWIFKTMESACEPFPFHLYEIMLSESTTSHIIVRKNA